MEWETCFLQKCNRKCCVLPLEAVLFPRKYLFGMVFVVKVLVVEDHPTGMAFDKKTLNTYI